MKASLLLEIHGWRGFRVERDLFCVHLVGGVLTLIVCRNSVSDRMKDFRDKLAEIKKRLGGDD